MALWIGGVAAVILELAEPSIRAAIWDHSSFRSDPLGRLRRTGMAAMMTIYGPRSMSQAMIAGVVRMHGKIHGTDAMGRSYSANDARLLTWVQATAAFGFGEAYHRFVRPLTPYQFDRFYLEGAPISARYGVDTPPCSQAELLRVIDTMRDHLQPSESILQFLRIMNESPALPRPLRPMQPLLVRAAVELVPGPIRERLGLSAEYGLTLWQRRIARLAGLAADRIVLPQGPAAQACLRLGYPVAHLYDELPDETPAGEAVSDLHQALQQLNAIRTQVARDTQFRGYGPASIAASGLLALAVAAVQSYMVRDGRDFFPFLFVWAGTAAIAIGLTASETIGRARRVHDGLANEMILLAAEQFLPALAVGVLLTGVLVEAAPQQLWMLPGLWQLLFSLGVFASCRFLPRQTLAVGVWYLVAGLTCIVVQSATKTFSPWTMGVPFGVGQLLVAAVLQFGFEKASDDAQ